MDALDEAHFPRAQRHDHRGRPGAFTEEADALHQCAVCHACGGEDNLLARRQIFGFVDTVLIFDSHALQALFLFRLNDEAPKHVSIQAANSGRSDHAFRSPA